MDVKARHSARHLVPCPWRDAVGQVIGITDRNGRQRTFADNDLGEKTSETSLDENQDPLRIITWGYDDAGRMISASDPDSSYSFT